MGNARIGNLRGAEACWFNASKVSIERPIRWHMNEQDDDFDEATPEEIDAHDQQMAEMEAEIQDFQDLGWRWSEGDRILVHPDDPEMLIRYDPFTGEKLLSQKLLEHLRVMVERERAAGLAGPLVTTYRRCFLT